MDKTYYLKKLKEQGKLPKLLGMIGLPTGTMSGREYDCKMTFSDECLTITELFVDDYSFGCDNFRRTTYKLNDYMFLEGVQDPEKKKLPTFFGYMKGQFDTYTKDCIFFITDQQDKRCAEIDEKSAKEKDTIRNNAREQIYQVLGVSK